MQHPSQARTRDLTKLGLFPTFSNVIRGITDTDNPWQKPFYRSCIKSLSVAISEVDIYVGRHIQMVCELCDKIMKLSDFTFLYS